MKISSGRAVRTTCPPSRRRYPKEDGYAQFLESNGGGSNAFTASTHTNYFFAVQPSGLREAMDRLAQFFVSPILVKDQVSREVLAVNAENDKNQQSDGWRKDQLLRSLASKGHPYHKFDTGSNVSLNVPNITGRLSEWYHYHYGAHVMTLAVVGNQPLDQLQVCASTPPLSLSSGLYWPLPSLDLVHQASIGLHLLCLHPVIST